MPLLRKLSLYNLRETHASKLYDSDSSRRNSTQSLPPLLPTNLIESVPVPKATILQKRLSLRSLSKAFSNQCPLTKPSSSPTPSTRPKRLAIPKSRPRKDSLSSLVSTDGGLSESRFHPCTLFDAHSVRYALWLEDLLSLYGSDVLLWDLQLLVKDLDLSAVLLEGHGYSEIAPDAGFMFILHAMQGC